MSAFIFWYTVGLILVCFAAAMLAVGAYAVSHRRALLPQISFFAAYIAEISGIFGEEWLAQNLDFSAEHYYDIPQPALRIFLGAAILLSLWLMLLNLLDVHNQRLVVGPMVAFVVASLAVLSLSHGQLRQWLFYSLRQLFSAAGLAFAFWKWRSSTDEAYRTRLSRHKARFVGLFLLLLATFLEDSLVIMILPAPSSDSSWLLLYLSERNFSENILMLYVAYHSIRMSLEQLSLRRETPPSATMTAVATPTHGAVDASNVTADSSEASATQSGGRRTNKQTRENQRQADLSRHIADTLPRFSREHNLSDREAEVLSLVVEGKTNREIAEALFLSEGTIKTHVHNITKKCGASSRKELRQTFWAS